nr:hypothetical protein [Tanacetum cinerariifolium]
APPSPDYIPGPEEPQTPPAPQDEDEHELMFIQPHDPDFVPEPIYPEYIPLEDEHILSAEEQPLPLVDHRDNIPESEQPPRKRLCLATIDSRHQGITEVGYGIRYTWIDPAEAVPDMASTTLKKVNTRVTELAELQ